MEIKIDYVLLVDDDFDDNYIYKMVISSIGFVKEVVLVKDGLEVFQVLEELW